MPNSNDTLTPSAPAPEEDSSIAATLAHSKRHLAELYGKRGATAEHIEKSREAIAESRHALSDQGGTPAKRAP